MSVPRQTESLGKSFSQRDSSAGPNTRQREHGAAMIPASGLFNQWTAGNKYLTSPHFRQLSALRPRQASSYNPMLPIGIVHSIAGRKKSLSLTIIQYPHPTLRHRSKPLKRVDADLRKIVAEMFELMYQHEGVGLAANQVDLPYRLFVANIEGDRAAKELECVFINPVLSGGRGQEEDEEGCLSIPGIRAPVTRNQTIRIQGYDLSGNEVSGEVEGLMARIVQHETDHLEGTLFIDRLAPTQLAAVRDKLEEFELDFHSRLETGELPSVEQVAARLSELERLRT
jgi:peptide deformylase